MLVKIHYPLFRTSILIVLLAFLFTSVVTAQSKEAGFNAIFDGKTLNGWEGDANYWRVENGSIVGEITADKLLKTNTFIIWKGGVTRDFELKLEYKISEEGNSGINYRSELIEDVPFALKGYQADIDGKNYYTGQNYEERGRTTLAYRGQKTTISGADDRNGSVYDNVKNNAWTKVQITKLWNGDSLQRFIKASDWNEIHLIVKGNRLTHLVNGVLISEVTDNDNVNRKLTGLLGVQVHVGPPMRLEFRNVRFKKLM